MNVTVSILPSSNSGKICGYNGTYVSTLITFLRPRGASLPLIEVVNYNPVNVTAYVSPVVDGVDSVMADPSGQPGLYTVLYTPTVAGAYNLQVPFPSFPPTPLRPSFLPIFSPSIRDINHNSSFTILALQVQMGSVSVANDLVDAVVVMPSQEYAPTSTHNASQVVTQGTPEYFTVQMRDMFGNALTSPMASDSSLVVTMTGVPASCGIDVADPSLSSPSIVTVTTIDNTPYSDGTYPFTYTPTVAGSYVLDIQLLTRGGLLGTYYKGANLTYPVLASRGNFHDPTQYHTPYWCDGMEVGNWSSSWTFLNPHAGIPFCDLSLASHGCGCDSTRLDQTLSFAWGDVSPLPFDDPYTGE